MRDESKNGGECGMKDIQFNSGMRDKNRTAGPGHAPFRRGGGE